MRTSVNSYQKNSPTWLLVAPGKPFGGSVSSVWEASVEWYGLGENALETLRHCQTHRTLKNSGLNKNFTQVKSLDTLSKVKYPHLSY